MSALIEIGSSLAYIDDDLQWQSDDLVLLELLKGMSEPFLEDGPSGADPHPAETLAMEVTEKLGGRILDVKPLPRVKDRIY